MAKVCCSLCDETLSLVVGGGVIDAVRLCVGVWHSGEVVACTGAFGYHGFAG